LTEIDDLLKAVREEKELQKAHFIFTSGLLRGWVHRLSTAKYEDRQLVYQDMLCYAKELAKAGGLNFESKS